MKNNSYNMCKELKGKEFFYKTFLKLFIIITVLVASQNKLFAATRTYIGPTGTGAWSTASNWSGGFAPATGDDVVIPSTYGTLTFNNVSVPAGALNSLTISSTGVVTLGYTSTFTLSITTLTITNGGLTTTSSVNLAITGGTIASGKVLTIGSSRTMTVSGTLTVDGSISNSGTITVNSGGLVNFSGSSPNAPSNFNVSL